MRWRNLQCPHRSAKWKQDLDRRGSKNRAHLINMPNLVLATTLNRCPATWACLRFLLLRLLLFCLSAWPTLKSIIYRSVPMQSCNWHLFPHLTSFSISTHRLDKFDQPPPALAMSALACWILGNDIIHVRLMPHLHLQFSTWVSVSWAFLCPDLSIVYGLWNSV